MVNPPNALPDANLGQDDVTDRLYRGFCRDPKYLEASVELVRELREEIEALFRNQQDLSSGELREFLRFMESFYRTVDRQDLRERRLKCRGSL